MPTFGEALGIADKSVGLNASFTLVADLTIPGFEGAASG